MHYALKKGGKFRKVEDHRKCTVVVYKRFALAQDEKDEPLSGNSLPHYVYRAFI